MDENELKEIRERAERATPGPWVAVEDYDYSYIETTEKFAYPRISGYGSYSQRFICSLNDQEYHEYEELSEQRANAAFIAIARQDIPALIAEVERLRAALAVFADKNNWIGAEVAWSDGDIAYAWYVGAELPDEPWKFAQDTLTGKNETEP